MPEGLATRLGETGGSVSGGEARRLMIARAVMMGGDLILADEPTADLDPETAARVIAALLDLNRQGRSLIVATHDPALAAAMGAPRGGGGMTAFLRILRLLVSADPWSLARGALMSVVVLLMGAGLLGLSGWFITATGLAGLAGLGIAFDVFQPAAGVRALALGRAAARYGERLLTHDATLRALAALRVSILRGHATRDASALMRLRSEGC